MSNAIAKHENKLSFQMLIFEPHHENSDIISWI